MSSKGRLLRILGITFGIAVTVGGTVGAGILRTPGIVAAQLNDNWLILTAWIFGGAYAFLGTISVAELGAMLPQAGCWYVYARRAFGNYGGFTIGWSDWMAQSAALAWLATTMGELSVALNPSLSVRVVAIGVLIFFALLHRMGMRLSSRAQEITSLLKAVALILFVGLCFLSGKAESASPAHPTLHATGMFAAIVIALQSVIATYDGWYTANYFAEEDKDPGRNLPRSVISSILITIAIYLLVNVGLLYALPLEQFGASKLAYADVAEKIFGSSGGKIVTALSVISLLSVINAVLLLATRILFAISRDGFFSSKAADVSEGGTPVTAMLMTTVVAICLVASGTFEILLAISAFLYVVIYNSGFLALFILRKREPDLNRPFRVWGYPWTTLIALTISTLFLIAAVIGDTKNSLYALLLIVISYPAYLVTEKIKRLRNTS